MAVTTGATLSGVGFVRHFGLGPYISSGGNVYFFGVDATNTGQVEPHKASDPMSAFTAQTLKTMSSASSTAIEAMSTVQVGNVIHVATQIATGAGYYNFYTMDTDTWGLTTSETALAASTSGFAPGTGYTDCSLAVRSGGNVVFWFAGGVTVMSGTLNTMYYRIRTGTNTYGTATQVASGTNNYAAGPAVLGASDRVHFFYKDNTNSDGYSRTLSSANALSTASAFETATTDATQAFIYSNGVSFTSGANTEVRALYQPNVLRADMVKFTSADSPSATTEAALDTNPAISGTQPAPIVALAADGDTLHALYQNNTNSDLYWATSAGGGGAWGVDTNELAGTILRITSNVYTRSGSKYLAMVLNDAATIKYAEITLTTPASLVFEPSRTLRMLTLR